MAAAFPIPLRVSRMVEWSILAFVVLILIGIFGLRMQAVQGQAERAAVKATLGALRTALVIDQLKTSVAPVGTPVAVRQHNPFLLLHSVPVSFAGELAVARGDLAPEGSWVFDPACVCVGYRLRYPQWMDQPAKAQSIWFHIGAAAGPLLITPFEQYLWQGELVN